MKTKIKYLTILIMFTFSMHAQKQGNIEGIIVDNNQNPLEGATVIVKTSSKYAVTDGNGKYFINGLEPNSYEIQVSYMGYLSQTLLITVAKTVTTTLSPITMEENLNELSEVVVSGSLFNKTPHTAKAGIKPLDLPQSAVVISQQALETQQVNSMTDILKNTNGVYIMGTTGGYQEEIAARGYRLGSSNTFKNGVRFFNGMMTETSGVESMEVLKGSAAILFGNVQAGGVINIITKKPRFNSGGKIGLAVGSFNLYKPSFDVYGPIEASDQVAFRFNGSYATADSFRNYVGSETTYFNPSFLFKLNSKTNLLVEADYTRDQRTPDFGAGVIEYELVNLPREQFVGVLWGYNDAQQVSATATLTTALSKNWNLAFINSFRHYNTDLFTNTRPNTSGGTIALDGTWARSIQRSEAQDNYALQQIDLKGSFKTGKIDHQFLIGADNELFSTKTLRYNRASYDEINIFSPDYANFRNDIPDLGAATLTTSPVSRFGVYIQDLIGITDYVKLLAGVRYTYQDTESDVFTYATTTNAINNSYDDAITPRFGIILQPTKNNSIFASYSNSFETNSGTDIDGNSLKPSYINQYEIGIKNELLQDKLFANITVYQIINSNLAQTSLENGNTNTNIRELVGEVQSKGVEVDIAYRPISGLYIMAGYSFNETKYTKTNTYIVGDLLRYNPNNTANASASYEFTYGNLKGLKIGLLGSYFGERFAGRNTRITVENDDRALIPISDYFNVDATISYKINHFTIGAKLANIGNVLNFNVHDDNSLNPIAPRNFMASVTYNL